MTLTRAVVESFVEFCRAFGIALFEWQAEAFGGATAREGGRFVTPVAAISVPRGNGKTDGLSNVGLWRFICGPGRRHVLSAALDEDGASITLEYARRRIEAHPDLARAVEIRANELLIGATGSRWTITSREHTASRGLHPTDVLYDEMGWARDDELFASLLAAQASVVDPLMLVASTVGRRKVGPLWQLKELAESGDSSVSFYYSTDNLSPLVTPAFLARQRRLLLPGQFAREHQNTWVDAVDSFTSATKVDAAMRGTEAVVGNADVPAVIFVDIGTVHDPSVVCLGYRRDSVAHIARLITFQGSPEKPVEIAGLERVLRELAEAWAVARIRVESWQGVGLVQSLRRAGLPVELYSATQKVHAEEWPVLAHALAEGTVVLFPHQRLRDELLNLTYEVGPAGVRVLDRGKVHQDHAVAVRGVVAMLLRDHGGAFRILTDSDLRGSLNVNRAQDEADASAKVARDVAAEVVAAGIRNDGVFWPGG